MEIITPRISGSQMGQFIGRIVFLVCDATSPRIDGHGHHILKTTDGFEIVVILPPGERFENSFVQIEGKVLKPNVIECLKLQTISDGFDVNNYNKALELSHGKFRDLFL